MRDRLWQAEVAAERRSWVGARVDAALLELRDQVVDDVGQPVRERIRRDVEAVERVRANRSKPDSSASAGRSESSPARPSSTPCSPQTCRCRTSAGRACAASAASPSVCGPAQGRRRPRESSTATASSPMRRRTAVTASCRASPAREARSWSSNCDRIQHPQDRSFGRRRRFPIPVPEGDVPLQHQRGARVSSARDDGRLLG